MPNEIESSKKIFNKFFREDLYGVFDDDKNIILSRGTWEDGYVSFPKIFSFCINYTLKNHWIGYSDSLGHKNTLHALRRYVNTPTIKNEYGLNNLALTLGNVANIGFVFKQLKKLLPNSSVITLKPYYPPILKSINSYFKKIHFVSSLQSEEELILQIKETIESTNSKILLLSNSIGVEGRIFSVNFWEKILKITKNKNMYLVIDEGMWFKPLNYGNNINDEHVIRIVSLSKKYGIPGCKLGFMISSNKFIHHFYDCASTNYGGPLSIFFLLSEFIYQFEFITNSGIDLDKGLQPLYDNYKIPVSKLKYLYDNFKKTLEKNKKKLSSNRQILDKWVKSNSSFVDKIYDFGGINVFIKLKTKAKAYDIFLKSIAEEKISIMPSSCLGDKKDSMFRITLLEKPNNLKKGLTGLAKIIKNYEKTNTSIG